MFSTKQLQRCPQVFKNYDINSNFKIFKVMKSTSKTKFSPYHLSITFNDKFWKSHLVILCLSTQHNYRKFHQKNHIQETHFCLELLGV